MKFDNQLIALTFAFMALMLIVGAFVLAGIWWAAMLLALPAGGCFGAFLALLWVESRDKTNPPPSFP